MFRIKPIRLTAVLTLTLFFFVFFIFFSDFTLSKEEEDNLVKKNKIGQSLKMSVAIAQMINHLQLQPRGHQYYEGTHYTIEENMNYRFNWSKIANELSDTSPTDEFLETALF